MTNIHDAVREVLRVRDEERVGDASTEDLLDAIAGLEDAKYPPTYASDLDEVLFTMDLALDTLSKIEFPTKGTERGREIREQHDLVEQAKVGLESQLRYYCPESPAFTALRWRMRELGYDMLSPMAREQETYIVCIMAEEVGTLKPFIEALKKEHPVQVAEGQWEPAFAVSIVPSSETDADGFPYIDLKVTRTGHKAIRGGQAAA